MDAMTALRNAVQTKCLGTFARAGMALMAGWSMMAATIDAQAAPTHTSATSSSKTRAWKGPTSSSLATAAANDHPGATVDPDNPPPPDGYQVVQDEDVTAQTFSPAITALHGPGLPSIEAHQTPRNDQDVPSHFSVFGVPVKFDAPVQPAYNASFTYSTYAGQPGRGIEAIGAEGAAGEP